MKNANLFDAKSIITELDAEQAVSVATAFSGLIVAHAPSVIDADAWLNLFERDSLYWLRLENLKVTRVSDLSDPVFNPDTFRVIAHFDPGLFHTVAGKKFHHTKMHGLLAHLADMWKLWNILSKAEGTPFHSFAQRADQSGSADWQVLTSILAHDLHKAHDYTMTVTVDVTREQALDPELFAAPYEPDSAIGSAIVYGRDGIGIEGTRKVQFDYAKNDDLIARYGVDVDATARTVLLLNQCGIIIRPYLMHAIVNAEGGYAQSRSRTVTELAKIVYMLDELSVLNWRQNALEI